MKEEARKARNLERLGECNPVFALRIRHILERLESDGYRPRIQDAYRSQSDQLAAFRRGTSRLKQGFHNMLSPDGKPDALAVDVLDDNMPLNPGLAYLVALARAARAEHCQTGIAWGLPVHARKQIERLMDGQTLDVSPKVGWDPCHVETAEVSLSDAIGGKRP